MGAEEEDSAADALMALSRTMTAIVARSLGSLHDTVTVPQLRVLVIISRRGPLNLTTMAEALGVNPSSASRMCDKLTAAGLLSRDDRVDDRRNLVIDLTEKGQSLVSSVMETRRAVFGSVVARMSASDRGDLTAGIASFAAAVSAMAEFDGTDVADSRWVAWLA